MNFPIDRDVPLPPRKGGRPKNGRQYPFGKLGVGESFFVPGVTDSVRTAASSYQSLHPDTRFTTRYLDNDPKYRALGVRVWRTK
jgi:hypothetical protein